MEEVIIISNIRREELRLRTFSWSQIPPASNTKTPGWSDGLQRLSPLYVLLCITPCESSVFAYKPRYFLNIINENKIKLSVCYPNAVTLQNPWYKGNKTLTQETLLRLFETKTSSDLYGLMPKQGKSGTDLSSEICQR